MASVPPKNYLSKIDEFAAHWPQVNTALGSALLIPLNYGVANLATDSTSLATQITAVEAAINTNADTATVLGNHLAGDLTPFETDEGLVAPGSKMFYKVFVKLITGNEKGSKTASAMRAA